MRIIPTFLKLITIIANIILLLFAIFIIKNFADSQTFMGAVAISFAILLIPSPLLSLLAIITQKFKGIAVIANIIFLVLFISRDPNAWFYYSPLLILGPILSIFVITNIGTGITIAVIILLALIPISLLLYAYALDASFLKYFGEISNEALASIVIVLAVCFFILYLVVRKRLDGLGPRKGFLNFIKRIFNVKNILKERMKTYREEVKELEGEEKEKDEEEPRS